MAVRLLRAAFAIWSTPSSPTWAASITRSEIKLGLLRRLAATTVQAELLEARMVNGEQIDIGQLCTLASTTVRIASRLGVERRTKPVLPTVKDYLEHVEAAE